MQRARPWDVPVLQEKEVALPAGAQGLFRGLCEVEGHWSSFDVTIQCPESWAGLTVRAVVDNMGLEQEVGRMLVGDIEHPINGRGVPTTPALAGTIQGQLFRITARPCTKFRIEVLSPVTTPELAISRTPAKVWIRASGPDSVAGDRSGRLQTDPFARRHQQVQFAGPVVTGINPIPFIPAALLAENNAAFNRIYITGFLYTTNDAITPQTIDLRTVNTVTTVATVRRAWLAGRGTGVIQETFSYPLRPDRGDVWDLVISAVVGLATFSITGFVE